MNKKDKLPPNPMKTKLIIAVVLILPLVLFFGFLVYHTSGESTIRDGKLFAGSREVSEINMQQYKRISDAIAKDSSFVFYKGKIVKGVDAPTFERLPYTEFFYRDKTALYFERWGVFTIHKLVKLDNDYDVKTMKSLGIYSLILCDKNGLYVINNNPTDFFNIRKPLKRIDLAEVDTATFQQIASEKGWTNAHFYGDTNRIFFATYGELRPCSEIDRNSFQIVDFYLFKDKNRVYYLTQYLESETKKRTLSANYTVLEGADGATFHKIRDANDNLLDLSSRINYGIGGQTALYEDKNGQWEIYHIRTSGRYYVDKFVIRKVKK